MRQPDPAYYRWKRRRWTRRRVRLFLWKLPYSHLRLRLVERLWVLFYALAFTSFAMFLFDLCRAAMRAHPAL